jgi:hypothetical protein
MHPGLTDNIQLGGQDAGKLIEVTNGLECLRLEFLFDEPTLTRYLYSKFRYPNIV